MSAPPSLSATGSRSRPQARKKPNDDASYFGPPLSSTISSASAGTGNKRHATDRLEGEVTRAKRKKVDNGNGSSLSRSAGLGKAEKADGEVKGSSMVDFMKMSTATLHRYLSQYDLVPLVHPSPLTAADPPPPSSLDAPTRHPSHAPSPAPSTTPANRPRREPKERRRSARLVEEEVHSRTPVLADVDEVHCVLAGIVERHFREEVVSREVDMLASFMCAVDKARGGRNMMVADYGAIPYAIARR